MAIVNLTTPLKTQLNESNNIFTAMQSLPDFDSTVFGNMTPEELNAEYIYNQSGEKKCSPLLRNAANSNITGVITSSQLDTFAGLIYHKFKDKWKRLYNTFIVDYNPIDNYNMTETTHSDSQNGGGINTDSSITHGLKSVTDNTNTTDTTVTLTHGHNIDTVATDKKTGTDTHNTDIDITKKQTGTGSDTTTIEHGKTVTTEASGNENQNRGIFGFNTQDDSVPYDEMSNTNTGNSTVTDSGTDTTTQNITRDYTNTETGVNSDTITYDTTTSISHGETHTGNDKTATVGEITSNVTTTNSGTDTTISSSTDTRTNEKNSTVNRSGNIGVTTTQQMLTQERELLNADYYNTIYRDIDSVLCLSVY